MIRRFATAAAAATCLAVPAVADARSADATVNPLPRCVQIIVAGAPEFVVYTAENFVNNGELPRLMGPFLPC